VVQDDAHYNAGNMPHTPPNRTITVA
jgi:hypothetical protein